jgi:hypothetical protein
MFFSSSQTVKLLVFVLFVTILLSIGCAQESQVKTYPVAGIVTVDGVPTEGVIIQFVPAEGATYEAALGTSGKEGKFTVTSLNGLQGKGAMAGDYKVIFIKNLVKKLDKPVYSPEAGMVVDRLVTNALVKKYEDVTTTPISATVIQGKNSFKFDVESKK